MGWGQEGEDEHECMKGGRDESAGSTNGLLCLSGLY